VERVIGFFSEVLTVEREVYDEFLEETISEVVPFNVEPSQAFILGSLFGWRNKHGHRRFRRCYIEIGKGNGKSPMAAGIGHYMMLATKKLRAEIYSAATDKDQAAILFRDAVEMWRRSPHPTSAPPAHQLRAEPGVAAHLPFDQLVLQADQLGEEGQVGHPPLLRADRRGPRAPQQRGHRDAARRHQGQPAGAPNNEVIEMLRAGTKGNQQALIFEITNSGMDLDSTCGREHEYSIKIANGELKNDAWFSYVCALDEGDDPFEDESCWEKANPEGIDGAPAALLPVDRGRRGVDHPQGVEGDRTPAEARRLRRHALLGRARFVLHDGPQCAGAGVRAGVAALPLLRAVLETEGGSECCHTARSPAV
jgi:hypothetical protein